VSRAARRSSWQIRSEARFDELGEFLHKIHNLHGIEGRGPTFSRHDLTLLIISRHSNPMPIEVIADV
jgi:hypothetical protein